MSKYVNLTKHLAAMDEHVWSASFDEVEEVIGMSLPESARQHRPWWANQGRAQSLAWQSAGWTTANVDLENEKVTFIYVGGSGERRVTAPKLTIAEAKAGLAANFNVSIDAVEITIRG